MLQEIPCVPRGQPCLPAYLELGAGGTVLYPALTLGMKKMVRFLKGLETSPSRWDQMPENREDSCRGCRPHSRQRHCPSLSVESVQLVRLFQQIVSDTCAEFWS